MARYFIFNGQRSSGFFVSLIFLLLILIPSGCGDDHQSGSPVGSAETASASLMIRWHEAPNVQDSGLIRIAALDCQAGGVENVVCEVYDTSGNLLVTGGPWRCSDKSGRVDGIPVGENRTFVVLAEDADDNIRYQGETTGITIEAGKITKGVVIDVYPFISTLYAPDDGAQVDPNTFSFEWEPLENAIDYLVQVAEDIDFETIIIYETTPGTVYAPSTLEMSVEYFWKISAVDLHNNIGAESEVRSFATSDCTYAISSASNSFNSDGGSGSLDVTSSFSDCEWLAETSASWITITSGEIGSGNGTVSYTVAANTGAARSAQITIAGQTHTVSQDPVDCTYTIAPTGNTVAAGGGVYEVTVTATHADCDWTASENTSWITLSPTTGSGGDTVRVTVSANTGGARSARITIAGHTHTVSQEPVDCTYTIAPTGNTVAAGGDAYDVTVTATHADCDWTTSENTSWITLSPTTGSGGGTVRVTVSANTGAARSAQITIAGQTHTVSQDPVDCTYTIAPTGNTVAAGGGVYEVTVTATHADCDWTASENTSWITLSPTTGSGGDTVRVTVSANTGGARSARITIAGHTHTVSQEPVDCTYTIAPTGNTVAAGGDAYDVTVTATHADCDWTTSENTSWITLSPTTGSGGGTVRVTVSANTGAARSARITIAGQTHTVSQDPVDCTYTIAPTGNTVAAGGGAYDVTITATHADCDWTTSENTSWITLSPTTGSGGGTVRVTVLANTGSARSAQTTIAGRTHTVNQEPDESLPDYTITALSLSAISLFAGDTVNVTYRAVNQGGAPQNCVNMAIYLSTDATITTSDTQLRRWGLPDCNLAAGESISQTWQVTIPTSTTPGSYYIGMIADVDQYETESNENNNTSARAITIIVPENSAPRITNPNYRFLSLNDPSCRLSLPYGSLFEVTFNYTDVDGNGPTNINQANLDIAFDFPFGGDGGFNDYTWNSSLSGDGSQGVATTLQCYRFGDSSYVDVTMTIEDLSGATSNALTIRIDKPSGSN